MRAYQSDQIAQTAQKYLRGGASLCLLRSLRLLVPLSALVGRTRQESVNHTRARFFGSCAG